MSGLMKKAMVFFTGSNKKKKNGKGNKNLGEASEESLEVLPEVLGIEKQEEERMVEEVGEEVKGKEKKRNKGKLFVGGLKSTTTSKGLEDHFAGFGKVVDAVVVRFPDTLRSRGFGFVTFAEQEYAELALGATHVLDGKVVDVRACDSKERQKSKGGKFENRVFLGGLPLGVAEEDLRCFFARYGKVSDVNIPSDRDTKKPKGYGFLSFEEKGAVEECLAEEFVYFRGRRVQVKRARDRSGFRSASDFAEEDAESFTDDETLSSVSSDEKRFVKVTGFKEIFEEYLRTKPTNDNTIDIQPPDKNVMDLERMLLNLMRKEATVEDLIDFSDDDNDSEDEDGDDDVESNSDCSSSLNSAVINFQTALNQFRSNLADGVAPSNEVPLLNEGYMKEGESLSSNLPAPFTTKGSLLCSLCQWRPDDGSCESFLAHCKTPAHRNKIRDRFCESKSDPKLSDGGDSGTEVNPELVFSEKELHHQGDLKKMKDLDRGVVQKQQGKIPCLNQKQQEVKKQKNQKQQQVKKQEKQNEQQVKKQEKQNEQQVKKQEKQNEQQVKKQEKQNEQQVKKQENQKQQQVKKQEKQKEQEVTKPKSVSKNGKTELESEKIPKQKTKNPPPKQSEKGENKQPQPNQMGNDAKNLKIHAFAKGMVSIQPLSENELHCKMCNKIIPKAQDFAILMKNVSQHLHSKKHLNNLLLTENSLKSALEKQPEPKSEKGKNCVQGNSHKEKEPPKVTDNKNKNPKPEECKNATRKQSQGSQESLSKCGTGSKGKNVAKAEIPALNKKTKGEKKMVKNNGENKFVCFPCNFSTKYKNEINVHLNSSSHLQTLRSLASVAKDYTGNFHLCKVCDIVLFGSLYDINKHNSECVI